MNFPIRIQFRNMTESDFVYNDIYDRAEKLGRYFDRITSCQIVISAPHRSHQKGKIYHVEIRLNIPAGNIFITTEPEKNHAHEDAYVAVRDAFHSAYRRLEEFVDRERKRVDRHRHDGFQLFIPEALNRRMSYGK